MNGAGSGILNDGAGSGIISHQPADIGRPGHIADAVGFFDSAFMGSEKAWIVLIFGPVAIGADQASDIGNPGHIAAAVGVPDQA